MRTFYDEITKIAGNVVTVKAQGIGYDDLAVVTTDHGTSLAQVIRMEDDQVSLQIFGGTEGLSGIESLPHGLIELIVAMAVVWIALFSFTRMMNSDYGLILKGINDNDRAVMSAGLNIYYYKAQALFLSSGVAAFELGVNSRATLIKPGQPGRTNRATGRNRGPSATGQPGSQPAGQPGSDQRFNRGRTKPSD